MPEPDISLRSTAIVIGIVAGYYFGVMIRHLASRSEPNPLPIRHRCLAGVLPCLLVIAAMGGIVECVVIRPFDFSMVTSSAFLLFLVIEQGTLLNKYAEKTIEHW
ncbi:MAG: hypothetical protein OXQ29_17160 [Rhodospirillaceae bacterium]|nr:hypothetical protein [Rhodospirillaceae bacterium]